MPLDPAGETGKLAVLDSLRQTFDTLGFADRLNLVEGGKPLRFAVP
ncbi:MAG TPA: hypothetical protein VF193_09920 [Steroidobacter sp.]